MNYAICTYYNNLYHLKHPVYVIDFKLKFNFTSIKQTESIKILKELEYKFNKTITYTKI